VAVAAEQVLDLIEQGIDRFHFYTLNRPELTYAMCRLIGLKPVVASVAEVGGGIADGQTARRIA
jgi:methylenetetrahydrofolate reductase (NADPH)